jgi:hypothetical protein
LPQKTACLLILQFADTSRQVFLAFLVHRLPLCLFTTDCSLVWMDRLESRRLQPRSNPRPGGSHGPAPPTMSVRICPNLPTSTHLMALDLTDQWMGPPPVRHPSPRGQSPMSSLASSRSVVGRGGAAKHQTQRIPLAGRKLFMPICAAIPRWSLKSSPFAPRHVCWAFREH